jgi:hypothetical protein
MRLSEELAASRRKRPNASYRSYKKTCGLTSRRISSKIQKTSAIFLLTAHLKAVFNNKAKVNMFEMTKLVNKHLS